MGKKQNVYHVNMLRKWHTSESKSYIVQGVPEETESHEDEIPVWDEGGGTPTIGDQLSQEQWEDLRNLLEKFRVVFSWKVRRDYSC